MNLRIPSLLLISSLLLTGAAFGSNPPTGDPDCDPTKPCPTCEDPSNRIPKDDDCPSSFNYSLGVGAAYVARAGNFLTHSRTGIAEGQGGKSSIRNFDDVRKSIMDTSNYQNTQMLSLTVVQDRIDQRLYSPTVFDYLPLPGSEFLKSNEVLRQVRTLTAFSNIEILPNGFEVKTWNISALINRTKVNNLYVLPSAAPIKITKFTNPDFPGGLNRLVITSSENYTGNGTHTQTKLYNQTNPDSLTVETYEGAGITGQLMERLTLTYSNRGARPWDYSFERRIERASNANGFIGGLSLILHNFETYKDFSVIATGGEKNGKRLVRKTTAYGTPQAQTTTYDYYLDKANPYVNGRLKSLRNPDGSWEYWEYSDTKDSLIANETKYSSWKDVPFSSYQNGIKEATSITKNEAFRTVTIQGQEVSKEKYQSAKDEVSGRLTYTESKWDGGAWADETTCYESSANNTPAAGRPIFRTFADGTAEIITYALVNGQLKITVSRGDNSTGTLTQPVITQGTRTTTLYNVTSTEISKEVHDIASNLLLSMETGIEFDVSGRVTKKVFNANLDDHEINRYGCCGLEFSRDRSGATQEFFRDNLKRVHRVVSKSSSTDDAITTFTSYNGLTTRTTRSDGTTTLLVSESTTTLDGLTRTRLSPDADGDGTPETTIQVTVRNASTGSTHTTTHPDGTNSSSQEFLDGSEKSSTDQAGNITTYDKATHDLNGGGIMTQTTAANGTQWQKSYTDPLGRSFRTELADGATSTATYHPFTATLGSRGKTATSTDPDGITVSYAYNAEGEQTETTRPMPGGQQQLTQTASDVINDPSIGVAIRGRKTLNGILISTSLRSGDGYRSKSINHLATNAISTSTRAVPKDGAWTITSTAPDGTKSVATYTKGQMTRQETFATDNSSLKFTTMSYDKLDRPITQADARTGTTTMGAYLENGRVTSVTEPGNRTTSYTYDKMGRTLTTDAPDSPDASGQTLSNITHTSYTPTGQVAATWGAQTNPTFKIHDALDRMVELRTYQSLAANTQPLASTPGFAKTTWIYSPERGFLTGKRDAADKGTNYTYTSGGRLKTRTWARGITTTYAYDAGMMGSTDYSDTTPDVTLTYDSFGRPLTQTNGLATSAFTYDPATLALDTETISYTIPGQAAFTRVLDRSRDPLGRDTGFSLGSAPASGSPAGAPPVDHVEHQATYGYSQADGRLLTVAGASSGSFTYSYLPSSNLLSTISSPAHTVTNTWEPARDILASKQNKAGTAVISQYDYAVNAIGQRTNLSQTGSAFASARSTAWAYDSLGQVTRADSSIPGLDRAYQFDMIGNRLKTADSLTLPSANNYIPNALNQYTAIQEGGTGVSPVHDDDGNMTSGPLPANINANSTLVWDGENRIIEATAGTSGSLVRYSYDSQSRRIAEKVGTATKITLYDGWNPIAEYQFHNSSFNLHTSRLWGMDLSGSMQGAGGVGGLLMVSEISNSQISNYFPTYDGNGNVSEYLNSSGTVVAHYEYDPFGRTTVATGPKANDFAHRFSTKPLDSATGLYYYTYRYYDPVTGRWASRDPIEERGGVNLYGFIGNDGVNSVDYLGLWIDNKWDAVKYWRTKKAGSVPAGPNLLKSIKEVADKEFLEEWIDALEDEIESKYGSKLCCPFSSTYTHKTRGKRIGYTNAFDWSVGSVSFDVPDYEVKVSSKKISFDRVEVSFSAERELKFSDEYVFNGDWYNPVHWFTDFGPSVYAGSGSPFFITGSVNQNISESFTKFCWFN